MNYPTLARAIQLARESGNTHTAQAVTDLVIGYPPPHSLPVFTRPRTLREVPPRPQPDAGSLTEGGR
jgi:hypothetical protein